MLQIANEDIVRAEAQNLRESPFAIRGLTVSYDQKPAVFSVDATIEPGKMTAIVGPNGAGKTTLLQILGTLDKPDYTDETELIINGESIRELNDKALAKFRNKHIGFIFQFHQLLPEFTALENVCIPAYIGGAQKFNIKSKFQVVHIL